MPLFLKAQSVPVEKPAKDYLEQKGEVYFSFEKPKREIFSELLNSVSVDNIIGEKVFAYANSFEFQEFLEYDIPYTVLTHPGDVDFDLNMKAWEELKHRDLTENWDFYPTYEAYVELMYQFEQDFPGLVRIMNIGQTVMGRDLLFAKISPQVETQKPVPQFMYTSTMHGDETAGFVLSLRLIHHLINNYDEDEYITQLLNSVDIWICPNENPDGTYTNDNSTVYGATRNNANNIDLNRNYPNPVQDPYDPQQPETTAMINFTDTINFIMSANMHGGVELVNFPFDSWKSSENKHADHDWWEFVMYEYVDTAHYYSPPGYMTGQGDGVTHGGDWYVIYGSRQDYFNYYRSCREFTLELSNKKLPDPSLLPAYWEYNYHSMINYIRQATYGVHGIVYDNETGSPLQAEISIPGYDSNNSEVRTSVLFGNYNRPLLEGNYNIQFSADDYNPITIDDVEAINHNTTYLNVALGDNVSKQVASVTIGREGMGEVLPHEGTRFFNIGANIFLDAIPHELWEFVKWTIDGEVFCEPEMTYALENNVIITAWFEEVEPVPVIVVYPEQIDFGAGIVGNVYSKNLTIENTGTDVLEIYSMTLEGDDVFYLEEPVVTGEYVINPGKKELVELFFMPPEEKEYSGVLHIECNDPESPEVEVLVSGKGMVEVAIIDFSNDTLDFGDVLPGDTEENTLTVYNLGNSTLAIDKIDIYDDENFRISGDFPVNIEPGQQKDFTVIFQPQTEGEFLITAVVFSNAGNDPEAGLCLKGTGVDPGFIAGPSHNSFCVNVYPNPLKPCTNVVIELETAERISVELYNLYGNLTDRIFEGHLPAGEHRLSLSSLYEHLQPGVYILSVGDGKNIYSQKIVKID